MTITVMTCERWGGDLHMIGSCAVVLISSRYTVVYRTFILNDKSIPARDAFICSEAACSRRVCRSKGFGGIMLRRHYA